MEGEGTGRGVSNEVEWLPGGGELLSKIMEIHLSPFTSLSFLPCIPRIFFHYFPQIFLEGLYCM